MYRLFCEGLVEMSNLTEVCFEPEADMGQSTSRGTRPQAAARLPDRPPGWRLVDACAPIGPISNLAGIKRIEHRLAAIPRSGNRAALCKCSQWPVCLHS